MLKLLNWNYSINQKLIIKNLNLTIGNNEYISIVGANGSGKSTFSFLLTNLSTLTNGEIIFNDKSINQIELGHKFGLVFQNADNQFVKQIVEEDITFALENKNVTKEVMNQKLSEVTEALNIRHLLKKEVYSLSGGQKQKVAIASQLIMDKEYFIFDESTSSLDPQSKQQALNLMKELHNKGKTVIHITHDIEEALKADRILIFNKGNIVKDLITKDFQLSIDEYKEYKLNPPFITKLSLHLNKLNSKFPIVSKEEDFIKLWK